MLEQWCFECLTCIEKNVGAGLRSWGFRNKTNSSLMPGAHVNPFCPSLYHGDDAAWAFFIV